VALVVTYILVVSLVGFCTQTTSLNFQFNFLRAVLKNECKNIKKFVGFFGFLVFQFLFVFREQMLFSDFYVVFLSKEGGNFLLRV
jgi:hypothetical protein